MTRGGLPVIQAVLPGNTADPSVFLTAIKPLRERPAVGRVMLYLRDGIGEVTCSQESGPNVMSESIWNDIYGVVRSMRTARLSEIEIGPALWSLGD